MRRLTSFLLVAAFCLGGCANKKPPPPDGVLVVAMEQTASWVRNFNPLTSVAAARWPSLAGVYEPLYVFNSLKSEYVPWLAVSHKWMDDNLRLRLTTRDNVRWSDGAPFSARDVVFTFNLTKAFPGLDGRGIWAFLESVDLVDERTVDFRFQRIFIPGLDEIVAQRIVPEHHWGDVEDPVTWANENPVATGPFTEVRVFRNQVYELGRNPYYWQEGKPQVEALRFPAYVSNDRSTLALVFDEVDWAGKFVPAIDRVFTSRDPDHHQYWFPLTGSSIFLYVNTQRPPFNDVRVRKALSMAIDRDLLVDVAAYRYTQPADATGLSDAFSGWHNPEIAARGDWTTFDPEKANALLDQAGYPRNEEGLRTLPDGSVWNYNILSVSGWSDWVRGAQVIARNLEQVGIQASVQTRDFGAWFQRVQEGDFDLSFGWSFEGPTPYLFYRWLMSSATLKPEGESSMGNWHRYSSPQADAALTAFEQEEDPARQKELSDELQRIFVEEAPAIPLYPNPSWAEYNTRRFTGFPSPENPYADPSPNKFDRGDVLLVLTTLAPRKH